MKSARQEILDKLKKAVYTKPEEPDFNAPVYHSIDKPLELAFKENLEKVNGSIFIFNSEKELYSQLKTFLYPYNSEDISCAETEIQTELKRFEIPFSEKSAFPKLMEVGITGCEFLIAHTGSIMVSSAQKGGRQLFVYPPVHLIIAKKKSASGLFIQCLHCHPG